MARAGDRPAGQAQLRLPPVWFGLTCDQAIDRAEVPAQVDDYIGHMTNTKKWRTRKLRPGVVEPLLSWSAGAAGLGAEVAAVRGMRTRPSAWVIATNFGYETDPV